MATGDKTEEGIALRTDRALSWIAEKFNNLNNWGNNAIDEIGDGVSSYTKAYSMIEPPGSSILIPGRKIDNLTLDLLLLEQARLRDAGTIRTHIKEFKNWDPNTKQRFYDRLDIMVEKGIFDLPVRERQAALNEEFKVIQDKWGPIQRPANQLWAWSLSPEEQAKKEPTPDLTPPTQEAIDNAGVQPGPGGPQAGDIIQLKEGDFFDYDGVQFITATSDSDDLKILEGAPKGGNDVKLSSGSRFKDKIGNEFIIGPDAITNTQTGEVLVSVSSTKTERDSSQISAGEHFEFNGLTIGIPQGGTGLQILPSAPEGSTARIVQEGSTITDRTGTEFLVSVNGVSNTATNQTIEGTAPEGTDSKEPVTPGQEPVPVEPVEVTTIPGIDQSIVDNAIDDIINRMNNEGQSLEEAIQGASGREDITKDQIEDILATNDFFALDAQSRADIINDLGNRFRNGEDWDTAINGVTGRSDDATLRSVTMFANMFFSQHQTPAEETTEEADGATTDGGTSVGGGSTASSGVTDGGGVGVTPAAAASITREQIINAYQNAIGRAPSGDEISRNMQTTLPVLNDFLFNDKAVQGFRIQALNNVYLTKFDRKASNAEIMQHLNNGTSIGNLNEWADAKVAEGADVSTPFDQIGVNIPQGEAAATGGAAATGDATTQPPLDPSSMKLVRFSDRPEVFDISSGAMRHIGEQEFARLGNPLGQVTLLDPAEFTVEGKLGGAQPTITINGQIITIDDAAFNTGGLAGVAINLPVPTDPVDSGIFPDADAEGLGIPAADLIAEYTGGAKLVETWRRREDLQAVFNSDGTAKEGSGWEGLNIEDWAFRYGWLAREESKTGIGLQEYTPENMVRAAYLQAFAEDINETNNPDALVYIRAIRDGKILEFEDLLATMKVNAGADYQDLSQAEKDAIGIYWVLPGDPNIPEFEFDEDATRKQVQEEYETYWDEIITDYQEEQALLTGRTEEDHGRILGRLEQTDRIQKDEFDFAFERTLRNANRQFEIAGQAFSGIRKRALDDLQQQRAFNMAAIDLNTQYKTENADRIRDRKIADINKLAETSIEKAKDEMEAAVSAGIVSRMSEQYKAWALKAIKLEEAEADRNLFNIGEQTPQTGFQGQSEGKVVDVNGVTGETNVSPPELTPSQETLFESEQKKQAEAAAGNAPLDPTSPGAPTPDTVSLRSPETILGLFNLSPEAQANKLSGAVRITGQDLVHTIGSGIARPGTASGGTATAVKDEEELLSLGFQAGSVQEISAEEAKNLGITQ